MFFDHDIDFDTNRSKLSARITVNRKPTSDNKLAIKKFIDDNVGIGTLVRFNQGW